MSKDEQNILSKIYSKLEGLEGSVETIRRGVYGDKDNNVLGLLDRQEIDEQERQKMKEEMLGIKNSTWKLSLLIASLGTGVGYLIKFLL